MSDGSAPADPGYQLRYASEDEWPAVAELDGASFGFHYSAEELESARHDVHLDRILVATDGTRIVGASAELPFAMTVPGGASVAATGLSWVSVELTHRRRGILRALMERQLRAAAGTGEAAVILTASEGGIYGRYGFGVATRKAKRIVQRRRARLARPVDASAVVRMTTEQVRPLLPALHERWRALTPGAIDRDHHRWHFMLADQPHQRAGASGLFHLVHPDGYLSYRISSNWGEGDPQHECIIVDYAPITPQGHAALWQTLLSMDLVGTIRSYWVPVDDPLSLMLTDARAIDTVHLADGLWVRPTNVPALLGGRRYGVEIDCVLEIADPLLGDGRFRLSGGPDGATCTPTADPADVRFPVDALGALSLGGLRLGRLVRAGTVEGRDPALLARLELALLAEREPSYGTAF